MMRDDLISDLHASGLRGVLAITGGGSGAIPRLLTTPGASATVLEAIVPYSEASLADWLGRTPERACDPAAARALAMRSYERAAALDPEGDPRRRFGLGGTASLASTRPKRGEHRAHLVVQTAETTLQVSLRFEKGRRSRAEEEEAIAHAAIAALADAAGVHELDLSRTPSGIEANVERARATREETELLLGERTRITLNDAPETGEVCLLPGSFNPPHAGHRRIAAVAAERTGRPVVHELSITNVDKSPLDFLTQHERVAALEGKRVWLTRTPTFAEKAELAPGAVFAVGADTLERLAAPRYYADESEREASYRRFAELGCCFLVFGREEGGRFVGLKSLTLPATLRSLCDGVSEAEFRVDASSTELRDQLVD
ncbi:Cytidylyltransferase [Planctomycetes bacterium MalM25]|nr:Cytidylyltransferase [Planctomycetes bacterium MalM25]